MGISILELVLQMLRDVGFDASVAYPGQKYPVVSGAVAAVHIEKVDRADMTVTLEVNIICPAAMGGTQCEIEALKATERLRWLGAQCVQNGCRYDGISQVYVVPVLATFVGVTEAETCEIGPGFYVYVGGTLQGYAYCFSEEEVEDYQAEYTMGESGPAGISSGKRLWKIRIEDLIPDLLLHHDHQNFLLGMKRDAKKCRGILPGNATGIEDRATPGTMLPCYIHHILGKAGIDDGKNHFMVIGLHLIPPCPCGCHLRTDRD